MINTKKILFLLAIFIIAINFILISGCSNTTNDEKVAFNEDNEQVKSEDGLPVMLEFYADYCPPCQQMKPIISELQSEYDGVVDIKTIDVQTNQELASHYKIEYLPTQVYLDRDGKEVFRNVGFSSKEDIKSQFKANDFE